MTARVTDQTFQCHIVAYWKKKGNYDNVICANSLQELIEECIKWSIRYKQSPVQKSDNCVTNEV